MEAGHTHTCSLSNKGEIRCWGDADIFGLGYDNQATIGDNELPSSVGVINVGFTASSVTAGLDSSCALSVSQQYAAGVVTTMEKVEMDQYWPKVITLVKWLHFQILVSLVVPRCQELS